MKEVQKRYRGIILLTLLIISGATTLIFTTSTTRIAKGPDLESKGLKSSTQTSQYISSITISAGTLGSGLLSNTYVDDENYIQYNSQWFGNPFLQHVIWLDFNFNPLLSGGDYYLSVHIESTFSGQEAYLIVNGQTYECSTNLNFDNQVINDVTSIAITGANDFTGFSFRIFYFKLVSCLIQYEPPAQWNDFSFTKGSGGAKGDLVNNNNNFARIDAGTSQSYGSESLLGIIKPKTDILTNWNEGDTAPHASRLDEAPEDNNGDGGNIRESSFTVHDRWYFTPLTIPSGYVVTKLVINIYCKRNLGVYTYIKVSSNAFSWGHVTPPYTNYAWKSFTKSGLSINQDTLNTLYVDVCPAESEPPNGWVDIEAVYIQVYKSPIIYLYSFDYQITWDIIDLNAIDYLRYDYRTTSAVDCALDIYNWDSSGWLELESNITTGWITDSYYLTDPYISATNQVKIRFQTATSTSNFDMELDQICIQCFNPEEWDSKTLIGSTNRYFPNIEVSKLGFTINTIDVLAEPIIDFSIKEDINPNSDPNSRYFRLYVDGIKIFDEFYDIQPDGYHHNIVTMSRLGAPGGHQIVIEINSGQYGDNPHYKLEYLKVGGIEFDEIIHDMDDDKNYSPVEIYKYGYDQDNAVILFNTHLYYSQDGILSEPGTFFSPSTIFYIDPGYNGPAESWALLATKKYYLHSSSMEFRIIDPNGEYVNSDRYAEGFGILPSVAQEHEYSEILHSLEYLNFMLSLQSFPEYLDFLFNILDVFLYLLPDFNPDMTSSWVDPDTDTAHALWTTGYTQTFWGYYPNHFFSDKFSMWVNWGVDLGENAVNGSYQVETTWFYDVYVFETLYRLDPDLLLPVLDKYNHWYAFTISETCYINFEYNP
ncbi:MAG: hypothetical protein ACFFDF_06905 [Candidatus Odinarchaeota archaeon]